MTQRRLRRLNLQDGTVLVITPINGLTDGFHWGYNPFNNWWWGPIFSWISPRFGGMDGRRTWPTWIFFFRISQVPPGRFVADCCGGWCWLLVLLAKLPGMSFFLWTISHHLGSFLLETWLYRIDAWLVNVCSQEWTKEIQHPTAICLSWSLVSW